MPIDIGAGIAQMGETVGKFAGVAALEQQKSGLEAERLKLANDMAMQRESAGRQEQHTLDIDTLGKKQAFEGSEGEKNRAAQLEAHKISAGASLAAAGMHLQATRETIAATERLGDFKINEDGTASLVNKRTGVATPVQGPDGSAVKFSNTDKAKAQAELITTTKDQINSTVRLYETDLKQAQGELQAALKSPGAMVDPSKDPGVLEAKKGIDAIRQKYEPRITTMTNRMNALYSELGVKAGVQTSGAPGIMKYDAQGNRVEAPSAEAPATPGMIDSTADGPR